jgi:putative peptide zinc metalloprotease protein
MAMRPNGNWPRLAQGAFGEPALPTPPPRNATVQSLEPCELLELSRKDLLEVTGKDPGVNARICELLTLRDRPLRVGGITVAQRVNTSGTPIRILKDSRRSVYFQLSPQGWFVWERLDGRHSLRDLTMQYFKEFKEFAPFMIAEVIASLASVGFVQGTSRRAWSLAVEAPRSWGQRVLAGMQPLLYKRVVLRPVDRPITWLYKHGIRFLYTRSAMVIMAVTALAGFLAFLTDIARDLPLLGTRSMEGSTIIWLILLVFIAIFLHEAAHAFTVKSFGREVPGIGIGWYWFCPIAFVDTSDMWLANRGQRVAVGLAGVLANILFAGMVSIVGWFSPYAPIAIFCWYFALGSYLIAVVNLNPLLEYDGYYVLTDLLERPNFRAQTLRWLGQEFPKSLGSPKMLRGHGLEILYGLSSVAYMILLALTTAVLYRYFLHDWVGSLVPHAVASLLGWILAIGIVVMSIVSVIDELRGQGPA